MEGIQNLEPDDSWFKIKEPSLIKECGCKFEGGAYAKGWWERITLCKKHKAQKIKAKKVEEIRKLEGATTEINCEKCGKFICFCNDSDINCCYFYCKNCKPKV